MANNYYNFPTPFVPGTKVRSDQVNQQYAGIETAFDLLPTDPQSLVTGNATLGVEAQGATVNEFEVTMPDPVTAYANGQEVVFQATHTNDGAATLEVDGLGAVAFVRPDGVAMSAGDLVTGLFYVARYDTLNTRFQLVTVSTSYLTDAQAAAAAAAASAAAALVSETNAAASAAAAAVSETNAAASAVAAQDWAIRAEDDPVPPSSGGDGATTFSSFHWAQKSAAAAGGGLIQGTGTVNPNAGSGYDYDAQVEYQNASGQTTGQVGWLENTIFGMRNFAWTAESDIRGTDSAGAEVTHAKFTPEGAFAFYHNDNPLLESFADTAVRVAGASGAALYLNDRDILPTFPSGFGLVHLGGAATNLVQLNHFENGTDTTPGTIQLGVYDGSGQQTVWQHVGADGDFAMFDGGVEVARTLPAASGGLEANNTLTGAGFERVLTTSDLAGATVVAGSADGEMLNWNNGLSQWEPAAEIQVFSNGLAVRESASANIGIFLQNNGLSTRSAWTVEDTNGNVIIDSRVNLGTITFQGRDGGGGTDNLLVMTPTDDVALFDNNVEVARTLPAASGGFEANNTLTGGGFERVLTTSDAPAGGGAGISGTPANNQIAIWTNATDIEGDPELTYNGQNLTIAEASDVFHAFVTRNSLGGLQLGILNSSGNGRIAQTDSAGILENTWINLARNDDVALFDNNVEVARTLPAASGGFEVNNTSTGAGFERVLTTSDLGGGGTPTIDRDNYTQLIGNFTISDGVDSEYSAMYYLIGSTSRTITVEDSTASGILGAAFVVVNATTVADVDVTWDGGGSATAFRLDGSVSTTITVPPGGTYIFWRYANNAYIVTPYPPTATASRDSLGILDDDVGGAVALTGTTYTGILAVALAANTDYMLVASGSVTAPAADDAKFRFQLPNDPIIEGCLSESNGNATIGFNAGFGAIVTNDVVIPTSGSGFPDTHFMVQAAVKVGANTGTLTLEMAKNANTGGNGSVSAFIQMQLIPIG